MCCIIADLFPCFCLPIDTVDLQWQLDSIALTDVN